jgi:hypothetical protein
MEKAIRMTRAQLFLESWKEAETHHREISQGNDPQSHHLNKLLTSHRALADGKDPALKHRAKAVLRHFVKWREAQQIHNEKHKGVQITTDALANQDKKAIAAYRHFNRVVAPKERRYHKEAWMLNNAMEMRKNQTAATQTTAKKG